MNYEKLKTETNMGWNTWNSGNVLSHVLLPHGFAINLGIKDFTTTDVLREACIEKAGQGKCNIIPGVRSYDGSYTELDLEYCDTKLKIQSTADKHNQYIVVTPLKTGLKTPHLIIEGCILYGNEGSIGKENGIIKGVFQDKTIKVMVNSDDTKLQYVKSTNPYITVKLDKEILISTTEADIDEIKETLVKNKKELYAFADKYGINSEAYTAMKSCLAWDTIYDSQHKRICSTVSRKWNNNFGGYVLFDWDTYFAAMLASLENKELAYLNLFAITQEITPNGFIPNYAAAHNNKSFDRSQPPVGSSAALDIYNKFKEKWILEELYPYFLKWNTWFYENRTTPDGYMCWGSNPYQALTGDKNEMRDVNCRFGAALESGLDNSHMYDEMSFDKETHLSSLADVGLMSMYIHDCNCLIEIGKIIKKDKFEELLTERAKNIENQLKSMWNEEKGIYLNYDIVKGEFSQRISPTNFYPLMCEFVPKNHIERMVKEHLYNEKEFWGKYIIPSTPRNDSAYHDQNYWRGRIWAPHNYLVYRAFKTAGEYEVCRTIAEKSRELLCNEWALHGHVHENYNADTGMGCDVENSDCFYHWSGLLAYIAIDYENM